MFNSLGLHVRLATYLLAVHHVAQEPPVIRGHAEQVPIQQLCCHSIWLLVHLVIFPLLVLLELTNSGLMSGGHTGHWVVFSLRKLSCKTQMMGIGHKQCKQNSLKMSSINVISRFPRVSLGYPKLEQKLEFSIYGVFKKSSYF